MEAKHESKPSGLRVHIDSNTCDVDYFTLEEKFRSTLSRSSSSSPDSPLDDPLSKYELDDYSKGATLAKLDKCPQSETNHEGNANLTKPMPTTNIKPPSSQAMERPFNSEYRFPPHVFTRNKSTAPREWSVASTDSLFSINVGDYTFPDNKPSENLINMPSTVSERNEDEDESVVETEKKSIGKQSLTPSVSSTSLSSDVSMSSTQSFAFPILTENNGKDGLTAVDSVRIGFDYSSKKVKPTMPSKPLSQPPQPQKAESSTCSTWFSCFTCCKA